jgi:hypothetical protein
VNQCRDAILDRGSSLSKYKIVGGSFRFGSKLTDNDFFGPVVASDEAFFLFIDRTPTQVYGGLVGELVAGLQPYKQHDVLQYDASELPLEIREHDDWPLKKRKRGPVVVIPRDSIDRIVNASLGTYDLHCDGRVYAIGLNFVGRTSVRKFLATNGWDSRIDRNASPSLVTQLAPFLGIVVGVSCGIALGLIFWSPVIGLISIGLGMIIGLVTGTVIYIRHGKS